MRIAIVFGAAALFGAAHAAEITCRADRTVDCGAAGCAADASEGPLPVELTYDPATAKGELCTYTYCRAFTMLRRPGAPRSLPRLSGFVYSARSGSVGPGADAPIVDYELTIAQDGASFLIGEADDGTFRGWAGSCRPAEAP